MSSACSRSEALRSGARRLAEAGIENPRLEARLLLAEAVGEPQEALLRQPEALVDTASYAVLLRRREAGEPLAHILGRREFWSLDFAVSPETLIPRPESETLIEAAIALDPDRQRTRRVLDLGTGTGCLLLAALTEFPAAWGIGVDLVPAAAKLAAENARRTGLAGRALLLAGRWADSLKGGFDLVLANPPYIPAAEIDAASPGGAGIGGLSLQPEVARYEPRSALDGGADGLEAYRAIIPALRSLLNPGAAAVLEIGVGQAQAVISLAADLGFGVAVRPDLAGISRVAILRRP